MSTNENEVRRVEFDATIEEIVDVQMRLAYDTKRSRGVEMTVPWSQLTRVTNPEDGVELWFSTPALVRIPSRAFEKDDERTAIVQRVTTLAGRVAKPA